jgi:hypothetical protein
MPMAGLFGVIALVSIGFAIYVRLQPATVIRVSAGGEATMVTGRNASTAPTGSGLLRVLATPAGEAAPTDIEGRAVVRKFLESYMRYSPTSVEKNLADLRMYSLNLLRDQDLVGRIKEEQIASPRSGQLSRFLIIRGSSRLLGKEVHRVRNRSEFTDGSLASITFG